MLKNVERVKALITRDLKLRRFVMTTTEQKTVEDFLRHYYGSISPDEDITQEEVDTIIELKNQFDSLRTGRFALTIDIDGVRVPVSETVVLDGKRMLKNNLPNTAYYCEVCREWHDARHFPSTQVKIGGSDRVGYICYDTTSLHFTTYRCNMCNSLVLGDGWSYNNLCHNCRVEGAKYQIKRYHDNPLLHYYDYSETTNKNVEVSNNGFKGYGLELEIDNGGEDNLTSKEVMVLLNEEVYTMHDGSINRGFEIITHPHTEKALYNMPWADAFKWLIKKGYRSHNANTCGLHMHISRTLFDSYNESIQKLIYFYDKFRPEIIKLSRRTSYTADRWARKYSSNPTREYCEHIVCDYDQCGEHSDRYYAVNIQNASTVEIRIMRGTLKLETFLADLDFMITTAKNANNIHWNEVNDITKWLQGLKPETIEYLVSRGLFTNNTPSAPEQPYEPQPYAPIELEQGIRAHIDPAGWVTATLPSNNYSARIIAIDDPEQAEDETEIALSQDEINEIRRRIECV